MYYFFYKFDDGFVNHSETPGRKEDFGGRGKKLL